MVATRTTGRRESAKPGGWRSVQKGAEVMRAPKLFFAVLAGVALSVGVAHAVPPPTTAPAKVTLCHRTASHTNPYVQITVDQSAVFNNGIVPNGHGTHTGPVFPATGPDGKWGDIIPSFDGYPGQNLTPQGLAILNNGCKIPTPPTTSPPTTSPP